MVKNSIPFSILDKPIVTPGFAFSYLKGRHVIHQCLRSSYLPLFIHFGKEGDGGIVSYKRANIGNSVLSGFYC